MSKATRILLSVSAGLSAMAAALLVTPGSVPEWLLVLLVVSAAGLTEAVAVWRT